MKVVPRGSTLAVASLVATGFFLIAISLPPLYNSIFGEEPESFWWPLTVANGLVYLATAVFVGVFRTRLGVGLAMVLGMLGFTLFLSFVLSRFTSGGLQYRWGEVVVAGLLAAAHAVVVAGVLDGARRWNLMVGLNARRIAAAALLAGIGFALGLGAIGGGDYAMTLAPITMPREYQALEYTNAIPHFVAVAAIALNGRFATIGSLAVAAAGFLLALRVLAALAGFRGGDEFLIGSVILWALLLISELAAGLLLSASVWLAGRREASQVVRRLF